MRCGTHTVCMCYFEDKQNLKYKKNRKTYIQPVGYPHMAPDSLRRYLQVPPPCQGALNVCLLPAPSPGSRQLEGQIQSADCRLYEWQIWYDNLNAGLTKYTNTVVGKATVCMIFLYFIFTWSADRLGAIGVHVFLEEKGYVVGTLRMLNLDISGFMVQKLRIMLLTSYAFTPSVIRCQALVLQVAEALAFPFLAIMSFSSS